MDGWARRAHVDYLDAIPEWGVTELFTEQFLKVHTQKGRTFGKEH